MKELYEKIIAALNKIKEFCDIVKWIKGFFKKKEEKPKEEEEK